MKKVPFYGNHKDNHHCMLAAYRSIFDYFYDEKLDWKELEQLTGYKPKKAAWSLKIISHLTKRGMDIRMIEPFDYGCYYVQGESYLDELLSPTEKDWYMKYSNIREIKPLIPDFLENVQYQQKRATKKDIESMLDEDRLVFVTLNARVLNSKPGYSSHAVLVIDRTENEYIVHDPGLPPRAYRHVAKDLLFRAMGGDETTSEVTGFNLK